MSLKVMRTAVNEHVGDGVALAVMHVDQYKEGRRFCAKETAKAPHISRTTNEDAIVA